MKKAYVSGTITIKEDRTNQDILFLITDKISSFGYKIYCPERDTNKGMLEKPDITPNEIYLKDFNAVKGCDLLVLEVSSPSTGNGLEIMLAHMLDISIVLLLEKNKKLSRMVIGMPNVIIIEYINKIDLIKKLDLINNKSKL